MKINMLDLDPRQYKEPEKYQKDFGSFAAVARGFNQGLQEIGYYSDAADAEWVGICDGLNASFDGLGKKRFLINVWDMANVLPEELVRSVSSQRDFRLLGLSDQVSDLWAYYGVRCDTVTPGCDTNVWYQSKPKNERPTILFNSFSNVRSGLDLFLSVLANYGEQFQDCRIIIKNTSDSVKLADLICNIAKAKHLDLHYINIRLSIDEVRDLYSESHVSLNVMRHGSWGLGIHESAACGCVPIVGDYMPSNLVVKPNIGQLLPTKGLVDINSITPLLESIGFTNCYGQFTYRKTPQYYDFDIAVYAKQIIDSLINFDKYGSGQYNKIIKNNWSWSKAATRLVEVLQNA